MGPKCSMNMLWNTQIINTCIVFRQWHISSTFSFVLSFFVIIALGVLYEYLREVQKTVDRRIAAGLRGSGAERARGSRSGSRARREASSSPEGLSEVEDSGLLTGRRALKRASGCGTPVPLVLRIIRAILYGVTVLLSFFLMLVFMTYNAYLILAVVAGAALGHFIFGKEIDVEGVLSGGGAGGKGMACH